MKINIQWTLVNRIQSVEMKESGWNFQRINTMGKSFDHDGDQNGSSYVKITLRCSAKLNFKNDDNFCFLWSISAKLHPRELNFNGVSNCRQYFGELNIVGFDFSNTIKCSDMHRFEKINTFYRNMFELNFYQDRNKWKTTTLPIEVDKNVSDEVVNLLIYKNH